MATRQTKAALLKTPENSTVWHMRLDLSGRNQVVIQSTNRELMEQMYWSLRAQSRFQGLWIEQITLQDR